MQFPSYNAVRHDGWTGAMGWQAESPDDPAAAAPQYWAMSPNWQPVHDVLGGTILLRQLHNKYLPKLCNESDECYKTRILRSVLTPLYQRIVKAAVGLIMRKPIMLEGGDETYWEEWRQNVDRQGTNLDEFIGKVLFSSIAYGHCGILTDFPPSDARNLREEREQAAKPYFLKYEPPHILGWRHSLIDNKGQITQLRLREYTTIPDGRFGTEVTRQVRVLEPGAYELYREEKLGTNSYELIESGNVSLNEIPFSVVYSQREDVLMSTPPLLELAQLNLQHYQLQASLINSLHVASFPLLTLRGWDDTNDELAQLSVANALALPPEGGAEYISPDAAPFDAIQTELKAIEESIGTLGITMLARPKNVAESGVAKALDRADSNSMLSQISLNCEQALQAAMDWAGEFAGVQPPEVSIYRDFNDDVIEAGLLTPLISMFNSGILDKETMLKLLQRGEILDDSMDIEEIMSNTEVEELDSLEKEVNRAQAMAEAVPNQAPPAAGE